MPPQKWVELSIKLPGRYAAIAAEYLGPLFPGGALIEQEGRGEDEEGYVQRPDQPATVKVYLPLDGLWESQLSLAHAKLSEIVPPSAFSIEHREIKEEEWATAWKAGFKPLKVGPLLVLPPWAKQRADRGLIPIVIDPGMAFGTGSHPTTRLCLKSIVKSLKQGDRVLDLGAGSGILAIAAARLGASHVLALDIEETAVSAARENVEANGVENVIEARHGSLDDLLSTEKFDLLVANIASYAIMGLSGQFAAYLPDGGTLIVSGVSHPHLEEVKEHLSAGGFGQMKVNRMGDWRSITAIKLAEA